MAGFPRIAHGQRQLFEEERVALRSTQDRVRQRRGQALSLQCGLHDREAVVTRERPKSNLCGVRPIHPRRPVSGSVCRDEQDGRGDQVLDQGRQVLLGRLVDPVPVFDDENQRPESAAAEGQLAQRLESSGLDGLRAQRVDGAALVLDAEQVEQVRHPFSRRHADLAKAGGQAIGDDIGAVAIHDPAVVPDDLDDRQVRDGPAVGDAASLEHGSGSSAERLAELVE